MALIQIAWKKKNRWHSSWLRTRKGCRRRLTAATFVNICLRVIVNVWYRLFRSSHGRCSVKIGVLRNFVNLTGKTTVLESLFNKVAGPGWGSNTDVFLWNLQNFKENLFWRASADEPFNAWCPLEAHTYLNLHLIIRSYLNVSYY